VPNAPLNVRSWGQAGKHLLGLSFTGFDPERTRTEFMERWLETLGFSLRLDVGCSHAKGGLVSAVDGNHRRKLRGDENGEGNPAEEDIHCLSPHFSLASPTKLGS